MDSLIYVTIKSGLLALIGWNIDRSNQRFEHRQNDRCIGFSSIDSSTFPKISGTAVIDPHQNTTTLLKNKKLYEVAFAVRLEPVWEIQGLDSEVLQLMEVTSTMTFGFNSIESSGLTKVEPWVAKAKPGSYLHTRAIHQADGNSQTTANKIFALNQKDEEHRSENQSQYLIDGI